jgi:hypothetical protein
MRKVVAVELVWLDGVMESPEEWASSYSNDEMEEANASGMALSDALLLGRVTYEALAAFWPNQPGGTPMVDYINSVPKHVLSTTLKEPLEWQNSTLIKGNGVEEMDRMSNDATNGYAEVNGLNMYYERHGDGPPLVLLYGAFGTIESCFAGLLPELACYGRQDPHDNGPESIPERRVSRRASGRLAERIRAP